MPLRKKSTSLKQISDIESYNAGPGGGVNAIREYRIIDREMGDIGCIYSFFKIILVLSYSGMQYLFYQ